MGIYRSDSLKSNDSLSNDTEIENLKAELQNEINLRDNTLSQNNELEKDILYFQEQLQKTDYEWENDVELENVQQEVTVITEEIRKLKEELPELKEKIKNAKLCGKDCKMKHDNLNINLDLMNEAELLKTSKQLERMRTDLKSAVIGKEWSLDNEFKNYQRILEQKTHFQNILYNKNSGTPLGRKTPALDRWQNGGIPKANRTLDLKKGPINQMVAREKLPKPVSPLKPLTPLKQLSPVKPMSPIKPTSLLKPRK